MTTNHHTPPVDGAPANMSVIRSPLSELDAAITSQDARLTAEEAASTSLDGRVTVNESDIDAAEADINALDTRLTAEEAKISLSGVAGEFVNSDGDSAVPVCMGDTNGHTVQADGVSLTQRANLNFTGNGVIVTDRTTATDVNIAKRNFTLEPIDLTTDVQGALPIANGGTGQVTPQAGFEALAVNGGEIGGDTYIDGQVIIRANATQSNINPLLQLQDSSGVSVLDIHSDGNNNSFVGVNAGRYNTEGYKNSFVGVYAGYANTTGYNNSFIGVNAGRSNTEGNRNSFVGVYAGYANTTGYNNSFIGVNAGRYIADGTTGNETGNTSLYLGANSKALNDGDSNSIVIGYNTIGKGSNTVNIGNTAIAETHLHGALHHDGASYGVLGATPAAQQAHIVDADGTIADITTKFNQLLSDLEGFGFLATS